LVHVVCLVVPWVFIGALRSGARTARILTTICIAISFVITAWAWALAAPMVPMYAAPDAVSWLYLLLPLPPLLPPIVVLLLLWIEAPVREHFEAAGTSSIDLTGGRAGNRPAGANDESERSRQ